jgi:phosphatidylglycerophosphate synthase
VGGFTRAGLIGGFIYLVLSGLWLVLGHPPGSRLLYEPWFIALIVIGGRLPGPANQVTLARAYLALPALVYGLTPGSLGLLAVTVALAALSDLVDGTVARRFTAGPTRFGGALDPVVDGVFFGAVAVGLAAGGTYPWWLAAVVVVRYLLPALVGGCLLLMGRKPTLTHVLFGQVATTVIGLLLGGAALLRGLGQDYSAVVAVAEVVVPVVSVLGFAQLFWENRSSFRPRG